MTSKEKSVSKILMDEQLVERTLRKGIAHALWRHKRLGQSITVWRDGRVVRLSAEEIPDLPLDGRTVEAED
jgi:hypothetical protein